MASQQSKTYDWRTALGLTGVLTWLLMFIIVDYAHDRLMVKRDGDSPWAMAYEISAGYVLGFIAALSVWMLFRLVQGPVPEILSASPWIRGLSAIGLACVLAGTLAGLFMHNLGGLSLTYDLAFVIAILVVTFGVVPLYRR